MRLPKWPEETGGGDFAFMLLEHLTFSDCFTSELWCEVSKRRVHLLQQELYGQLQGIVQAQVSAESGGLP